MARILLGVSGGIAAYKALEFVRLATAAGHSVRALQTRASRRFVGAASFAALTGAPVLASEFERDPARGAFPGQPRPSCEPLNHLALVENADLYLIAPASANTIAKLAHGLADNLLCSCALAARCPLLVAPAMNNHMYEHRAVRANLGILRERGVRIIAPGEGRLASAGEWGIGRLAEPTQLLSECEQVLVGGAEETGAGSDPGDGDASGPAGESGGGSWRGLRVLVTAGGTREPIDSVRFLGNSSSGRMGYALAGAARARGAEVTLLSANVALPSPPGVVCREVGTAAQLMEACEQEFDAADVLLMAAAVADFRPAAPAAGKIERARRGAFGLELEPTADVLAGLAARRRDGQTLVGFAAEHGERGLQRARAKLSAKRLDAIVVNDISREDIGFDVEENEVRILTAEEAADGDGAVALAGAALENGTLVPRASKARIAEAILDAVERLRAAHRGR
jgi:phosphopantothenoylcysteine decarboxylase / phosphopantothenate---cysteine ligase